MLRLSRRLISAAAGVGVTVLTLAAAGRSSALSTVIFRPDATPPVLPGDVFNFDSASTITITFLGAPKPIVQKSTLDYSIKASSPFTFDGRAKLTKLEYTFPVGSANLSEALYVGFVPGNGAMEEILYGDITDLKSATTTGTLTGAATQTYPVGSIQSVFPEAAGQHWSPAATSTTVTDLAGKSASDKSTETDFADGSLAYSGVSIDGSTKETLTKTIASNGSGKLDYAVTGLNLATTTVGLPAVQHSKIVIPVTTTGGNPLPAKPAPATTVDVPDWYPSHDAPPKPLLSTEITDKGLVSAPAVCGKRAGTKAFDLHGVSSKLDPVAASYSTTVQDEYDAAGLGTICSVETSKGYTYSDTSFDAGKVIGTTEIVAVSILSSESGPKPLFGIAGGAQPFSLGFRFLDSLAGTAPKR